MLIKLMFDLRLYQESITVKIALFREIFQKLDVIGRLPLGEDVSFG